jgi:hypothetical protein
MTFVQAPGKLAKKEQNIELATRNKVTALIGILSTKGHKNITQDM